MSAELTLQQQISYIEGFLMYDSKEMLVLNPFIGISNVALLIGIRKSLIELESLKNKK
jgi:hypothetical protein